MSIIFVNSPIRRLGKKNVMLPVLLPYFPTFTTFVEPFSGSGAVGLNVEAKIKFLNDADANIFDAFRVFSSKKGKEALVKYLERVPYADTVWDYFRKLQPKNIIQKVAKFLILSNWGYMGKPETLRMDTSFSKKRLLESIDSIYNHLCGDKIKWCNKDFEVFLKGISFGEQRELENVFLYLDPPYLDTTNNYQTPSEWQASDLRRLVKCAIDFGTRFAMSEFENDTVLELVQEYGLNLYVLGERQNMKNRRTEILITNYEPTVSRQGGLFQ